MGHGKDLAAGGQWRGLRGSLRSMSEHNNRQHGGGRSQGFSSIPSSQTQHSQGAHGGSPAAHDGHGGFNLAQAALDEMHAAGFRPEFGAGVDQQTAAIEKALAQLAPSPGVEDLRGLGWSSIDNDTSKDLDQIEVADRVAGGIRLRVAIGDVAAAVEKGSPIDQHAQAQTQTIYTAVKNFPMLPLELSTGVTSLNEAGDRQAVMMTFTVGPDGETLDEGVSLALVRNRAQLAYSRVGPWLENTAAGVVDNDMMSLRSDSAREHDADASLVTAPGPLGANWLVEQLKMQDEAAQALHAARVKGGALEFHRAEADPVVVDGRVIAVHEAIQNRAMHLIEDLMVAANGVMARALRKGGRSGLQRVVVGAGAMGPDGGARGAAWRNAAGGAGLGGTEYVHGGAVSDGPDPFPGSGGGDDQADGAGRVHADAAGR